MKAFSILGTDTQYLFIFVLKSKIGHAGGLSRKGPRVYKQPSRLAGELTGKAAKPPAAGGGGDKKLTADEWLAEELNKDK